MLKFICFLALATTCYAASIGSADTTTEKKEIVPLLKFETDKKPDGSFSFSYEGGDKSYREETGVVENAGTDDEALEVSGSYRYIDADGREVEVHYTAGRNGFVPVGTNILSEISDLAKAAADLPNNPEEDEVHIKRRARSQEDKINVHVAEEKEEKPERLLEKKSTEKVEKVEAPVLKKTKEESTPLAKKDEEKKVEEKKVEEKKVEEKKVEEKKVEEKKPVEKKEEMAKVEDKKPVEKKVEATADKKESSKP